MSRFALANDHSKVRIVLPLFAVWLFMIGVVTYRIQTLGACASVCSTELFQRTMKISQARPDNLRLNQPYSQWACALNFTDPATYIKTGLGFADGRGVSFKNINSEDPAQPKYLPYYFQSPGTPIMIGIIIKLFGEQSVLPYFVVILTIYFVTALLASVLASLFIEGDGYIFGAGLLSLLCLPALDYDFGFGIFSSEPLAAPFVGIALIALSSFWTKLESNTGSLKAIVLTAVGFGCALALAAYCRDVYTTFAQFCLLVLSLIGCVKKGKFKQILVFVVISAITLFAMEHPWRQRNKHYFGEYAMTASTYYAYSMWYDMWDNYKERAKWGGDIGIGLGNYLAPEKSGEVLAQLSSDKRKGSTYALRSLIEAVCKRPWDALKFKLKVYDHLWFGQASNQYIYAWCLISTLTFVSFVFLTRFRLMPGLWLFPLFLICISPIIDYQARFSQPFFLFVTPVTVMYVLKFLVMKRKIERVENKQSSEEKYLLS
jgi:hypothetical protein